MPDLTDLSEPRLMLDLIMDALRVRDPRTTAFGRWTFWPGSARRTAPR